MNYVIYVLETAIREADSEFGASNAEIDFLKNALKAAKNINTNYDYDDYDYGRDVRRVSPDYEPDPDY